jgi:UPF0716 protein FxsA
MALYILLALVFVPLVEIAVFIEVGEVIGLWSTLVVVVLTAMAGTALLRQQGLRTLRRAQESLNRNEPPVREVFDGLCLLIAGVLLLTPGFVTDGLGGLLFLPAFRTFLGRLLWHRLLTSGNVWVNGERVGPDTGGEGGPQRPTGGDGTVLEGEFEEVEEETDEEQDRNTPRIPDSKWGRP